MYLKSLELNGFKSFAKKSELSFNTPITSIVGPNGSGKSNVVEAFRFVLGEQSLKSMRGRKGEDMIWNGSNDAARANRASIKIVFDNSQRFLNIDFDEVSIERAVYRDGVNEYSINGTKVRLKDIVELLASAHVGASGHHIISQGEADRILNSSPKDRKSMIEDALGLKIYQYKMEESERKLAKTEENIKSVESLRREVAPHIKFLKKQVEKVEKAAELRSELATLYKTYLKCEKKYLESTKAELASERKPVDELLAKLENELAEAKSILSESKNQDKKSQQVIELESRIRTLRDKKDDLVRQIGRIEGQISAEERIVAKERELSVSDSTIPLSAVEDFTVDLKEKLERAENESDLGIMRKIISDIRGAIVSFVQKHKQGVSKTENENSKFELEKLKTEKVDLDRKILEIREEEGRLSREYSDLRNEIDKEKDTNRAAEKRLFEVMTAQNEALAKRNAIKLKEAALVTEEEDYKREMGEAAAMVGREVLDFENFETGEIELGREAQHNRRKSLEKIKIRLEESGIGSADDILNEFRDVSERDAFLVRELADLEKSAESLQVLIKDFSEKISTEFSAGLDKINHQFEEFFSKMFGGGQAKLVVTKERKKRIMSADMEFGESVIEDEEPPEEGIEISVNLPKKKIKNLMMLSGGERALTSIALIFAMSQVKPPPFIILDETDAALDESNSKKYGDMIENLAKYSQLILITHNRETMSRAGILYGVTMMSGVSKLLSIKFDEAVTVAK